jgi:hypothetical protein
MKPGFHDDRDDRDRDDSFPFEFDSLVEFVEELRRASREGRLDDDAFDATFHFDIGTLDSDGPDDRTGPRGMGPGSPSRRGHPSFGGRPSEADRNSVGGDGSAGDLDPDVEVRERPDGTTEVVAELGRFDLTEADLSTSVVDDALVVVSDAGTLFEAPLPAAGTVDGVRVNNGILTATISHD